jgi:hypothetical protein
MQFRISACSLRVVAVCLFVFASATFAQNSIELFSPVDVRLSTTGAGYGSAAVNFNTTILNLTCSTSPITAVLSSKPDSTGYVLVDNNINVTLTANGTSIGPTNVCKGGIPTSPVGPFENCFNLTYQNEASPGTLNGQSPDTFAATGGVPPIDISANLAPGPIQLKIDLQDEGGYVANSTLYLNTNCTQGGVTGPALVSGNPISSTNPTPAQLSQDFSFNPIQNQQIGFEYDLTLAQSTGSLAIADGTIPQVGDSPLDPVTYQTVLTPQTSFATSICLVHSGELLPSGQPGCKLFTLECTVGTGANATGAQCPISSVPNEVLRDTFNGSSFTLPDIATPNGPTFHEGIGFLMASEGWTGGPCTFDTATGLQDVSCPQNLLSSFSGPNPDTEQAQFAHPVSRAKAGLAGTSTVHANATSSASTGGQYTGTGRTTRPNSTFVTVAQIPEDLTSITVAGQKPGGWINTSTASVTLSSQPPNLTGTGLTGADQFVASPIQTITYGLSSPSTVPNPGDTITSDTALPNTGACGSSSPAAATFTPGTQTLTNLADGTYLLHYYAQDCAGTQELKFTQDGNGVWSTSFYTFPINVDTAPPVVTSGPVLSPVAASGTYQVGQTVTATYSCSDALSGIVRCGASTYAPGATNNTGPLTTAVDTSSAGTKTLTVVAIDAAGNQTSSSINYQVVSPYDSQIQLTLGSTTASYPQGTSLVIKIASAGTTPNVAARKPAVQSQNPTGTVTVLDGTKTIQTLHLLPNSEAITYLLGLSAGPHSISVVYSGDANNPAGKSAPVVFTVTPGPVTLRATCSDGNGRLGADYACAVYAGSPLLPVQGVITYSYDGASPVTLQLTFGLAEFTIHKPVVGTHTVVIGYAAQPNYLAATPVMEHFTIAPAK